MSALEQAIAGLPGWEMRPTGVARYKSPKTGKEVILGWVAEEAAYGWDLVGDAETADHSAYLDDAISMAELEANR
jgi:hypothetical protein